MDAETGFEKPGHQSQESACDERTGQGQGKGDPDPGIKQPKKGETAKGSRDDLSFDADVPDSDSEGIHKTHGTQGEGHKGFQNVSQIHGGPQGTLNKKAERFQGRYA